MNGLPPVTTPDAPPSLDGGRVVAQAAAESPTTGAPLRKPSGAWFRKAKEAKSRGLQPPPLPPGTSLNPKKGAPGPVRANAADAAPPTSPPETVTIPADAKIEAVHVSDANGETKRVDFRLLPSDVEAVQAETAQAQEAEDRRAALVLGREELVKRVGAFGGLAFTVTGIMLGDVETWALKDAERDSLAQLFVDAWPEECAAMMLEGGMTKVIAVATLAQVVRGKWVATRKKRKGAEVAPTAELRDAPGLRRDAGRPIIPDDMRKTG